MGLRSGSVAPNQRTTATGGVAFNRCSRIACPEQGASKLACHSCHNRDIKRVRDEMFLR
jgi:hypothetical protein